MFVYQKMNFLTSLSCDINKIYSGLLSNKRFGHLRHLCTLYKLFLSIYLELLCLEQKVWFFGHIVYSLSYFYFFISNFSISNKTLGPFFATVFLSISKFFRSKVNGTKSSVLWTFVCFLSYFYLFISNFSILTLIYRWYGMF